MNLCISFCWACWVSGEGSGRGLGQQAGRVGWGYLYSQRQVVLFCGEGEKDRRMDGP